jgi:putative transposase
MVESGSSHAGSVFSSVLAPRRRVDVALLAVIMQAWIEGESRRARWMTWSPGSASSPVSPSPRCHASADSSTPTSPPGASGTSVPGEYLFPDATYCNAGVNGRVVSRAVVIATRATVDGS